MNVPFQNDYWFASTYSQRVEAIQGFLESDINTRTLIILDIHSRNNTKEILEVLHEEEQIPCRVRLILGTPEIPLEVYEFEGGAENKSIFVVRSLDKITLSLIQNRKPTLAIFN